MKVLIIGSGGREHALAWKLAQSAKVTQIYVAPGNPGTANLAKNINARTREEVLKWLQINPVDLVLVGPDNYLAEGIVDDLMAMNIKVFGPIKAAAQIEWSKAFAKQFMQEEGIPTAEFKTFTDFYEAKNYLETQGYPVVIKASGLAFGKGVVIANGEDEAIQTLENMMSGSAVGTAGHEVVIEEFLEGLEISVHAICDGETARLFPPAQDHKRAYDNDEGPNTGGMGTVAPVPGVTGEQMENIRLKVVEPTLAALKRRGCPFKGILFPGIMLTKSGPKVIEFNVRFGDPETQSYMRLLESDLLELLLASVEGNLNKVDIKWSSQSACCIVLASGGYPGRFEVGKQIEGLTDITDDVVVFHAGSKDDNGVVVTSGGRVLGVTAVSVDLPTALDKAYLSVENITFEGKQYRKDIGAKFK